MELRLGSLFAGIAGFDLGFHRAGIQPTWAVEIDPACQRVLRHHFPDLHIESDVREVGAHNLEPVEFSHADAENGILGETIDSLGGAETPRGAAKELEVPMREKSTPSRLGLHYHKLTSEQVEDAVAMYDGGMSIGAVAARYSVSRQGMWDLLRRRTTMRPQQRSGSDNHFYRGGAAADPEAHDIFEGALRRGEIVRPETCESCGKASRFKDGRTGIVGHHDDYNKPLEVRWLCQPCHHEWHKHNEPIRKEVQAELEPVDVITLGFP